MFTFRKSYLLWGIALLGIEILIALFVKDRFIRPVFGDFLVVIMLYCFARAFLKTRPIWVALGVLLFACMIEGAQYVQLVDRLGLTGNAWAETILGKQFDPGDLLAYALGVTTVWGIDQRWGTD